MKKKSHARAADKRNFSVALPITLIDEIAAVAKRESRSRNGQIEHFLKEAVRSHIRKKTEDLHSLPSPRGKTAAVAS